MRFARPLGLLALFCFMVNGCGGGEDQDRRSPALVSLAVTPPSLSLEAGEIRQFVAVGTYSDQSTRDLTSLASWRSSASSVALVGDIPGSKGSVRALSGGISTIVAKVGTVSGRATLTASAAPANVMAVSVNGLLCGTWNYLNKPCVSVTVCTPDLSDCRTVKDVLLDTGSYGLRLFKQAVPGLALPAVSSGGGSLAGCVQFVDGSSLWGPIVRGSVRLGGEPGVVVPIQIVDSAFGTRPAPCQDADSGPLTAGFNGILGVGVLKEDCGPLCASSAATGRYYSCSGAECTGTAVALADQVQNPVAHLPLDNNGLVVRLPPPPAGGASSLEGSVILGIGTRSNNTPASPIVFPTDSFGRIRTRFNGWESVGFFDTGSNGLFFPNSDPELLPICAPPYSYWYCPPMTRALFATNIGPLGVPAETASLSISNSRSLFESANSVFSDLGGPSTFGFDWGIPFFMGREVFFGIEEEPSPLGTGPLVAY